MSSNSPTLIDRNGYYTFSFYCDDPRQADKRLRYPTGVKFSKSISRADQKKIDEIKDNIDEYVGMKRLHKKAVLKTELRAFLDERNAQALPIEEPVILTPLRDLVQDHKDMIAQMRVGDITKKDGGLYSKNSIDQYERMRERWKEGAEATKNYPERIFRLSYEMTIDDCKNLLIFLNKKKASKNAIYDIFNTLKIFLKWSHKQGYHTNELFKRLQDTINVRPEIADAIAPTFEEIHTLYKKHFENPNEERARDFFVLGCFLGLRVNDLRRINEYHLIKHTDGYYYFEVFTQKGQKTVAIPAHYIAREIYAKYRINTNPIEPPRIPKQWRKLYIPGKLPVFHKSNLAQYLPKICKEIITGRKLITITKGGVKEEHHYHRWELMSPHTMRRFFATYYYCDLGLSAAEVMEFTGHKTEESFFRYIKTDRQKTIKKVANMIAFMGPVELSSNLSVVA